MSDLFAFGPFVLNAKAGTLLRDGAPLRVSQRGIGLLAALTDEPGRVVTKGELMSAAWDDAAVEEANLTVQIAALRKLLGTTPDGGEWITTVQRVGYRFAEVGRKAEAAAAPQGIIGYTMPSLAVLPFDNLGGDPAQEYFADGIVEDILTALSRFKSFAVVTRGSSFIYKGRAVDLRQVGRELGVRYALEGSVRRAGERLRVTAQLVDCTSGTHLWAERYDGKVDDVFDVQDSITESVVGVVEPRIREAEIERSRRDRPDSIEAYDLYLQALPRFRLGNEASNREAFELVGRALALQPNNPSFLAEASRVVERVLVLGWSPLTADDRSACTDFARRGLAVAGNDAAVLATCAVSLMSAAGDVEVGMATIQRAVTLNPNQSRVLLSAGIAHLHHGSLENAIFCFQRNLRLSPVSPSAYVSLTGVAHAQMALGRYEDALATAEQSLALSADYIATYWMLASASAQLGRLAEARRWLGKLLALEPRATLSQIRAAQPFGERVAAILEGLAMAGMPE